MRAKHIQSKRGFTLTELAIVLGVIGIVIGAIWYASANTHQAQKSNDAFIEAQTVAQNIATMMVGQKFQQVPGTNMTAGMITAQTIPPTYINSANNALADSPWSAGNFVVYAISSNTFRVSFYQVPMQGCLSLLTQMTNCQTGQATCPTIVYTNGAHNSCVAGQTGCTSGGGTSPGWTNMTTTMANTLCGYNSYTGSGSNSVEFDFVP